MELSANPPTQPWLGTEYGAVMALEIYRRKRDFKATPEPRGARARRRTTGSLQFVIQKHAARQLHYDFRLELNGVLLSWAVPKGPSLDPRVRRLAMHVEDHPIEYGAFEGIIPPRQYGAGTVMLWDRGVWVPREDAAAGYRSGRLKFELRGDKLRGGWMLVRSRSGRYGGDRSWLLIKENDAFARRENGAIVEEAPDSVATGRTLEEIAAAGNRAWHSNLSVADNIKRGAVKKLRRARQPPLPEGAAAASLPPFVAPQLATLVKEIPAGEEWLHEMKLDGYRIACRIEDGRAQLYTRNRNEWTARLPAIADAAARLKVRSAWLDGEIVVVLPSGLTSFQRLQNALADAHAPDVRYYIFDLPYLDGHDLRRVPLAERKRLLERLLRGAPRALSYLSHVMGNGTAFYSEACRRGLEGIVSKKARSAYQAGRGRDWLKIKCSMRQEMVIAGFTEPAAARQGLGALLLGVYEPDGALRYAGKVGTGFDGSMLTTLRQKLDRLAVDEPAFANPPRGAQARGVHWVQPRLVGEIAFTEWTDEGTLRHPSFQGLREDKPAREVVREKPAPAETGSTGRSRPRRARRDPGSVVAGVKLSNATKLLYPDAGWSKHDVARYYESVAKRLLPHIRNRPLSLVRCPDGWQRPCFFQKHANQAVSTALERVTVKEKDGPAVYMMANTVEALTALAQMGVLELHPWGSTAKKLGAPDRIVFDIDPDDELPWADIARAARDIRALLEALGLVCFLKTTGGKGLHVVTPVRPTLPWVRAKAFAKGVADLLARTFPDRFIAHMSKARRAGRIFVDYLRNAEGATAIAPYSLRARSGAPVAMPIRWDELRSDVRFDHFNLGNAAARLKRMKADPWAGLAASQRAITPAMMRRIGLDA